jgi:hypothetical protein
MRFRFQLESTPSGSHNYKLWETRIKYALPIADDPNEDYMQCVIIWYSDLDYGIALQSINFNSKFTSTCRFRFDTIALIEANK